MKRIIFIHSAYKGRKTETKILRKLIDSPRQVAGTTSAPESGHTCRTSRRGEESAAATIINGVTALGCGAQCRRLLAVRRTSIVPPCNPVFAALSPPVTPFSPSHLLHPLLVTHSLPLRRRRYRHPVLCLVFLPRRRFYPAPTDELLLRRKISTLRYTRAGDMILDAIMNIDYV